MHTRTALLAFFIASIFVAGCSEKKAGEPAKAEPPKDGLKDLIKEDVVIGKPTRFNPKMKPVENGDAIWVVYTGTLKTGLEFDSNDPKTHPDAKPFSFTIGVGGVIKGWDEGLLGMYAGGVRKLSIPYKMGYGDKSSGKIPPYSDLYFTVKVLDIVKAGDSLVYDVFDEKKGTGAIVKDGGTVTIHYSAKDVTGAVIEDTRKKDSSTGGQPVTIALGKNEALAAIEDGVKGMRVGGIRELALPPLIGFTPSETSGVPSNMKYYVRIELLGVK